MCLTGIEGADQRTEALDLFAKMYSAKLGSSLIREYISQTGMDALGGADILSTAPQKYASTVKYGSDTVGQYMRNIAQVYLAGLGTKILYTTAPQNSFDTHATEMAKHPQLWQRRVQCRQRLLPGPEGAQRQRQRRDLAVHGVWPARA